MDGVELTVIRQGQFEFNGKIIDNTDTQQVLEAMTTLREYTWQAVRASQGGALYALLAKSKDVVVEGEVDPEAAMRKIAKVIMEKPSSGLNKEIYEAVMEDNRNTGLFSDEGNALSNAQALLTVLNAASVASSSNYQLMAKEYAKKSKKDAYWEIAENAKSIRRRRAYQLSQGTSDDNSLFTAMHAVMARYERFILGQHSNGSYIFA